MLIKIAARASDMLRGALFLSMKPPLRFLVLVALGLSGLLSVHGAMDGRENSPPPRLPVETFFASPEISQLRFSPNGRYLAALVPVEHRMNLVVMDLEKKTKQLVTRLTDEGIVAFDWANDDRLLFYRDEGGRENYGLYAVNRDGGVIDRLAYAGEQLGTSGINVRFAGLLRRDRKDPNRFFVLANDTVRDRPDVASMDIRTGVYRVITRNPGMVANWVLDWNDVVRFGVTRELDGKHVVYYRDKAGDDWATLGVFDADGPGWEPLGFDVDNRTAYIASNLGRDKTAVFKFDTQTRQVGEMVCGDDNYDVIGPVGIGSLVESAALRKAVGVSYLAEKRRFVYWDGAYAHRQGIIDRSLPGMINTQIEATRDGKRIVIFSTSDREPGVYYLYDEANKKIEELAVSRPQIDPEQMAEMRPVEFRARDGRLLHGYLTVPRGRPAVKLPLVIHPHGGPYGPRDGWGFNPEVQFYANRGFAVLQIDYRGSGGYGREFLQAGYRQWGLAMQDDLSDGVKWAVAQGVADPARVVISGASYGGYAAMAGLTFTPELYCAGINYVGVTDLVFRAERMSQDREMTHWHDVHVGDLSRDRKRLRDTSPVNYAGRIRAPVLMGYGRNDPRVHIDHGYEMERALKRAGKSYELVIEENEGHGFRSEVASMAFFKRIDQFLATHVTAAGEARTNPSDSGSQSPDPRK
jgi:dipeptidyl aminopeptidase/acylaminoacyl peptidase